MATIKCFYMHTINGLSAEYAGHPKHGGQIVYAYKSVKLVPTMSQIRRERTASDKWRRKEGLSSDPGKYGYITVRLP